LMTGVWGKQAGGTGQQHHGTSRQTALTTASEDSNYIVVDAC